MKREAIRQQALALYIDSLSYEAISKQLNLPVGTIKSWAHRHRWQEIRDKAKQKVAEMQPEIHAEIVQKQVEITQLANKEILRRLQKQDEVSKQLEIIMSQAKTMLENREMSKSEFLEYANKVEKLRGETLDNRDLVNIMKHGLEVVRPKTQAQFNFLKQENNTGPTYRFEVIKPNDNNHTVEAKSEATNSV